MQSPVLFRRMPLSAIGAAFASLAATAQGVTYYKADNATSLTNMASWWLDATGTTPAVDAPVNTTSPSAVCIWNNLVTGPNTINVANVGIQSIQILNPGGPVTLASSGTAQTMTVGNNGGIDMTAATQDLTIDNVFYRAASSGANVNLRVAAGRTLTFGPTATLNVRNDSGGVTYHFNTDGTSTGTIRIGGNFRPTNAVIGGGVVEFNSPTGSSRLATPSTTVNGGKLVINNTSGSATGGGTVTVNSGGTLAGQGILTSAVTVNGTLIPKESGTGTLAAGSLTLAAGSTVKWEAVDPLQADLIEVQNLDGLTINGGTVELLNPGTNDPFTGVGTFNLFSFNGTIGGTGISGLAVAESTKIDGQTYTFGVTGNFVTLRIEVGSRPESFWNVDANGSWASAGNWTSNGVPDATSAIANLGGTQGTPITAPRTVTLGAPATVGVLRIDSAQPFTLAGTSTLTFDDGDVGATLHVGSGSHEIQAPLALPLNGLIANLPEAGSTLTLHGAVNGDGGLGKSGPGTLVVTADNYFFGTATVGAGTLQIGNGSTTGSINSPISNSGTVRYHRSDDTTLTQAINGTGGVVFAGTGKTTLSVPNTYSGPTTITAGTVELGDSLALQNSTLTHATTGGGLSLASYLTSVTLGGLQGDASFPLENTAETPEPISLEIGKNNANTSYAGSSTGTGAAFTKSGSGTLTLTGSHAFSGNTTIAAGTLLLDPGSVFSTAAANLGTANTATLRVNGGTFTSSAQSLVTNASVGIIVDAGTAHFDGGIITDGNSASAESLVRVNGGQLDAAHLTLSRGSLNLGTEPAAGQTNQGLYITNGTVHLTGALNIGSGSGANSSVSSRIDAGSLTVDGLLTLGINNTGRWSVFDANGGSVTTNDSIRLGSGFAGQVIMLVRNSSVVHTPHVQFGQTALGGRSILKLASGQLYVGAGGLTVGSTHPAFVAELRLEGGTLGALGNSVSDVPVTFNGPVTVTGASAADAPHEMVLSGRVTGTGSVTKNGAGTVLFRSPASNFTGSATVNAGTLGLAGALTGTVTANAATTFAPQGALDAAGGATVDGTLRVDYDNSAATRVGRLTSSAGGIVLGAGSSLAFNGTGNLSGAVHVVLKASAGITGTFATVTGLPPNFTLDYAYDDDNNPATPASVAIVNSAPSAFDLWIQAYETNGDLGLDDLAPFSDPDQDGTENLFEFAFSGDPSDPAKQGEITVFAADGSDVGAEAQLLITVAVRGGAGLASGAPATGSVEGIVYRVEGSAGLEDFTAGVTLEPTAVLPSGAPPLASGWEWKTFSLDGSDGLTGKGFLRASADAAP